MHTLALFQNLGWPEMLILLALGLLIFGRRLPEVGKSLGKGIVEFRKGLKGIDEEVETASRQPSQRLPDRDQAGRTPMTPSGEDVRVSRADPVERPAESGPAAAP